VLSLGCLQSVYFAVDTTTELLHRRIGLQQSGYLLHVKRILQLKYLQSNTRWRIVQCPVARWQCLLPRLWSKGPFIATQLNCTQLDVELSWVELRRRRYRHFADATELNSTSSWVELSCVAINGPLAYKGPFIGTQLNWTQLDAELSSVELSCVAINGPLSIQRFSLHCTVETRPNKTCWECRTFRPRTYSLGAFPPPGQFPSPHRKISKTSTNHTPDPNRPTTRGPYPNRPTTWGHDPNPNFNPNWLSGRGFFFKPGLTVFLTRTLTDPRGG